MVKTEKVCPTIGSPSYCGQYRTVSAKHPSPFPRNLLKFVQKVVGVMKGHQLKEYQKKPFFLRL